MKYKILLVLLLLIGLCSVKAQQSNQNILDSFSGKFVTAIRTHESQRAYLVTDKSVFTPGETIWFTTFLVNNISQRINTSSNFLFVDLVNQEDSVIKVLVLDAANQQFNCNIVLPDSLAAGYYWLRAYTRQMAEVDNSGISVLPIFIADKKNNPKLPNILPKNINTQDAPIISFYPEGGAIMTNVNSTVALKATDKNGIPLAVNITVKDNYDTIVANCTSNAYGLAKFSFEPSGYRKYKAIVNWNGAPLSYALPEFNFFAGQIAVTQQPAGLKLRVLLEDSIYKKNAVSYIVGITKDSLVFASIGKGLYEVYVGKEKIPDGITTFYLFDKDFNLLSERSVYIKNNNLHITVSTDKPQYNKRDKVTFNIAITDAAKHLIPSLVSIAVTDTLTVPINEQCTFKGLPYSAQDINNMLMAENECLTNEETDLLMYLKTNTYAMLNTTLTKKSYAKADSLLYITGTAFNIKNKAPLANKVLTLLSNLNNPVLYTDTTNDNGRFSFPVINYADSTQFAVQTQNLNGRPDNALIIIDKPNYPILQTPLVLKHYLPLQTKAIKKFITTYYNEEQINWNTEEPLTPVKVKYTKKINYDITKRVSSYSTILSADELDGRTSLGLALLRVAGIHMMGGLLVMDGPTSTNGFAEPLLIVDGASVSPPPATSSVGSYSGIVEYLNGISPIDVDFIEILRGAEAANYGVRGGNGVIIVNTLSKKREVNFGNSDANLTKFYGKGISNPVLFPVVDYAPKDKKSIAIPDTRSTLFWNGNYISDNAHNATITFYTSDIPAIYKATVRGVTIHGDIIYKTIIFQSK